MIQAVTWTVCETVENFHRREIGLRIAASRGFEEGPSDSVRLKGDDRGDSRRDGTTLNGGLPLFRMEAL